MASIWDYITPGLTDEQKRQALQAAQVSAESLQRTPQALMDLFSQQLPEGALQAQYDVDPRQAIGMGMEAMFAAPAGVHLPSTPLKPNPLVGTRFEREFLGGMADKNYVEPESMRGSSLLLMPWDSTSRNMLVKSVSDVELPQPVLTTGGQDFARDLLHIKQNIGGASNLEIADRILKRVDNARKENLEKGGTGDVYLMPTTMGAYAENFSTMPADILTGLITKAKLSKSEADAINKSIREYKVPKTKTIDGVKKRVLTQPFTNFKGIDSVGGIEQLRNGEGLDSTAGELRKALVNRLYLKNNQARLGFNEEDLINAITDPALAGVPKGYVGNSLIKAADNGMLLPSTHPAYSHDFSGTYAGSWLQNVPAEVAMPGIFEDVSKRHASKKADLRTMVLGDLEKSGRNVSQFVDDRTINSLMEYLTRNR
jgi:hypothetical protein